MGCQLSWLFSLGWATSEATNLWVMQDWGNKSTHVMLAMTMLPKVWMPYLVSTMSIR